MSYASVVNSRKTGIPTAVSAFGFACGAQWGDIAFYNPKEDGPYEEFFLESARTRRVVVKELPTEEEIEADRERIREIAEKKERLREQARQQYVQEQEEQKKKDEENARPKCACGCGRAVHRNPREDFIGYCCGWCKAHKGKRGHGEACGK